jgi:hypothetical protein
MVEGEALLLMLCMRRRKLREEVGEYIKFEGERDGVEGGEG